MGENNKILKICTFQNSPPFSSESNLVDWPYHVSSPNWLTFSLSLDDLQLGTTWHHLIHPLFCHIIVPHHHELAIHHVTRVTFVQLCFGDVTTTLEYDTWHNQVPSDLILPCHLSISLVYSPHAATFHILVHRHYWRQLSNCVFSLMWHKCHTSYLLALIKLDWFAKRFTMSTKCF